MSVENYSNKVRRRVSVKADSAVGELFLQDRTTNRGKGYKAQEILSFDAIFTYDDARLCELDEVPLGGGYFQTQDNRAEVTQLIGRFRTSKERDEWVEQTFNSVAT